MKPTSVKVPSPGGMETSKAYRYEACPISEGSTTWMVKRFSGNDYVESLIDVETSDPEQAIRAAVERGSWA